MSPPEPPEAEALDHEDKAAFKAKMMRLKNLIRTYDPLKEESLKCPTKVKISKKKICLKAP